MEKTVGSADRVIRIIAGLILIIISFFVLSPILKIIFIILGIIALVTAATRLCLLYSLLGINTSKEKDQDSSTE
ncbi:DUF2892 domain-containing protein [Deltaproteobacteria bacterium]|nr:DUF2892 domain-containing protein [Deltaproteobacteria bacterium]